MKTFFSRRRQDILVWIESYLKKLGPELGKINIYGSDLTERILPFISGGKAIRGGLVGLFEGLFNGTTTEQSIIAGAAMEFFQAALLIHDDIMDQDPVRRGMPSVYFQYQQMAEDKDFSNARRTGESLGICAGDAAFFLGFSALSGLNVSSEISAGIFAICAREMLGVSVAQMSDVANSVSAELCSQDDISSLYRYKTGRYTFSLPMITGGILGGADKRQLDVLSTLGEELGIIFQLRDDHLGLFGDQEQTGKPVGSDIAEGKQTLYFIKLMEILPEDQAAQLRKIFGKGAVTESEVQYIRTLCIEMGIDEEIMSYQDSLQNAIKDKISVIHTENADFYRILEQFIDYNQLRTI